MRIMYSLLKDNGKMICSDFHPFPAVCAKKDASRYSVLWLTFRFPVCHRG